MALFNLCLHKHPGPECCRCQNTWGKSQQLTEQATQFGRLGGPHEEPPEKLLGQHESGEERQFFRKECVGFKLQRCGFDSRFNKPD